MRRRAFIRLLSGVVVGWPIIVDAQEPGRTYRIGFLTPTPRDRPAVAAFFNELRLNGFVENQNLEVLPNGFDAHNEQLAELADALVKAKPDAIIAGPELPLRALQRVTHNVPLIGMSEDLVADKLVASLAHPGGNITGISLLSPELDGKRQDVLVEGVPGCRRIGAMFDSNVTETYHLQELQHAGRARGVEVSTFAVRGPEEIVPAMDAAKAAGADGLNFLATPLFSIPGTQTNRIVMKQLATKRFPAIFQWPETAEAGALLGYGPRFTDVMRQRARILVKILRGARPAEIPVEQPTRFDLVINLKAAKAIGHQIPAGLLARADEVIE